MFENRVLRRIFELNGKEAIRLRKLHNEELINLHSSPNIIRVIKSRQDEMGRACSMHGRYVYKIFDRKCERRRLSERPRCRLD
jgi:hypothetical protein